MHNDYNLGVHFHEPLQINLCITQVPSSASDSTILAEILRLVTLNQKTLQEIKMTDQEVKVLLTKVDETTNRIGTNLTAVAAAQTEQANVVQEISDDIDRLIAAGALSAENAASLQALADRLQASSDASDAIAAATSAQVPVLQAIAAKSNPVVPPPPPEPVI